MTLRITGHPTDADALANRALASACVLTDGDASATPALPMWAEAAQRGELSPDVGEVFDPPLALYSSPSDTVVLDLGVTRDSNAAPPVAVGGIAPAIPGIAERGFCHYLEE